MLVSRNAKESMIVVDSGDSIHMLSKKDLSSVDGNLSKIQDSH